MLNLLEKFIKRKHRETKMATLLLVENVIIERCVTHLGVFCWTAVE